MVLGFINSKINNKHKLLLLSNLPLLFYQPPLFRGKMYPPSFFTKLCNAGEIRSYV